MLQFEPLSSNTEAGSSIMPGSPGCSISKIEIGSGISKFEDSLEDATFLKIKDDNINVNSSKISLPQQKQDEMSSQEFREYLTMISAAKPEITDFENSSLTILSTKIKEKIQESTSSSSPFLFGFIVTGNHLGSALVLDGF